MPITSTRVTSIIRSGLAFHQALETAQDLVRQQCQSVLQNSNTDPKEALLFLQTMISPETLVNFNAGDDPERTYAHAYFVLKSEERHFREFASTNARSARAQRRRRGAQGQMQNQNQNQMLNWPKSPSTSSGRKSPRQSDIVSSSADDYTDEDAQ